MTAMGVIFSNIHDRYVPELTFERTMASVPFGGRYRLVDFSLSNMVNAGIMTVGIVTKMNYQSLMKHVGSGKDWDLDRKKGGLTVLPPFGELDREKLYDNRLEALKGIATYIQEATDEYIVLADCDIICNLSFSDVLEQHEKTGADITVVYQSIELEDQPKRNNTLLELDENKRVKGVSLYTGGMGRKNVSLNMYVLKRTMLLQIVYHAIAHGHTGFRKDVLMPNLDRYHIHGYEYRGFFSLIDSLENYLKANMALLNKDIREWIFDNEERPVFTRIKDSPPTRYGPQANVSNSIIADGCIVNGIVENSVLFRGVKVGTNTKIRNSVVMQDAMTGNNVSLNYMVLDKFVTIKDGRTLSGYMTRPFYIKKGSMI